MKEHDRKKTAVVRETITLAIDEDDIKKIVGSHVKKAYPDFHIQDFEIECGMSQGTGFFEQVRVELLCEREEVNDRPVAKKATR